MDRRRFLRYAGLGAASIAAGYCLGEAANRYASETQSRAASLRAAAEKRGLLIGAAVDQQGLRFSRYTTTLAREFNYLTPEYSMMWEWVHPTKDDWDFDSTDAIVNFASYNQMKVKGHPLIWSKDEFGLPGYLTRDTSTEDFRQAVHEHISTLVGRYKGKIHAWDVLAEAVNDDGRGLRKSLFLDKLGEDYIAEVFHVAHEADPDALLIYEDYGAEGVGDKSDGVYSMVKKLKTDGVPIDEVGLQMHIGALNYPKPEDIAANVRRLADLGLNVSIAEMDVEIRQLPGDLPQREEVQRKVYHDVIAACLKEKGFRNITFWGFTDAYSWIDSWYAPDDPLLFDENYEPKPAYWGVLDALLGA